MTLEAGNSLLLASPATAMGALTPAVAKLHPHQMVRTPPSEPSEVRCAAGPPDVRTGGPAAP